MVFPQYLWRVGTGKSTWLLRRGHEPDEPIEKFIRKDFPRLQPHAREMLPVGVLDYCDLGDRDYYTTNHPWDWLNE